MPVAPKFRQNRRSNAPYFPASEPADRPSLRAGGEDRCEKAGLRDHASKTFREFFPKPVKELVIGKVRRDLALITVKKDKIDIGAVIKLAAAELAQREYGKLSIWRAVALTQFGVPVFENCAQTDFCQLR